MSLTFVRRIAVAALALPLLLGGCADDEPVPKLPDTSSPTSPVTETSTAPVEPTLPPEAEGKGPDAAEAFVRHYYGMINYAQATGDTRGLRKLGLPTCRACAGGIDFIEKVYQRGGTNEGGDYSVLSAEVTGLREVDDRVSLYYLDVTAEHTTQTVSGAGDLDRTYEQGQADWRYEVVSGSRGWKIAQWAAK